MMRSEKQRIILSIHHSKTDIKSRWKELSPESRQSIREEFGTWMNNSYPNDQELLFLDYFRSW